MAFDADMMRDILLKAVNDLGPADGIQLADLEDISDDGDMLREHVEMLDDAGLIELDEDEDGEPLVVDVTTRGRELAENIGDEDTWAAIEARASADGVDSPLGLEMLVRRLGDD
jgi:hypothetical protein